MAADDRRQGRRRLAAPVLGAVRGRRGLSLIRRAAVVGLAALGGAVLPAAATPAAAQPRSLETLVGARLVVGMEGTQASAALLRRIRRGQVGGVILMGANVRSAPQVRELTARLRDAAHAGGSRLLIMTDQEGGSVRRFGWATPALSAEELGRRNEGVIRRSGRSTARALEGLGVNVDLAPVADIPSVPGSFIAAQHRGFSTVPRRAAKGVTAFAAGLLDGGVAPTLKHFPGLGRATASTDDEAVLITASAAELAPGLVPYRRAIAAGVAPIVMISNASYTAYGGRPAPWSPRILGLLRGLGFTGVTITDALEPLASTHSVTLADAAIRAARAGVDLLLCVGGERSTTAVYDVLLAAARRGRLPRAGLERSADRIEELAATYAG